MDACASDQTSWMRELRMPKVASSARAMTFRRVSGKTVASRKAKKRCLATRTVVMNAANPLRAVRISGRGRSCSHHFLSLRSGFTCKTTWANGASNRAASASLQWVPKSMTHVSLGRLVKSCPLRQGLTTSVLLRPCGLGRFSHWRAKLPAMSKSPYFLVPSKAVVFSGRVGLVSGSGRHQRSNRREWSARIAR